MQNTHLHGSAVTLELLKYNKHDDTNWKHRCTFALFYSLIREGVWLYINDCFIEYIFYYKYFKIIFF